jgi:hypothetical protein
VLLTEDIDDDSCLMDGDRDFDLDFGFAGSLADTISDTEISVLFLLSFFLFAIISNCESEISSDSICRTSFLDFDLLDDLLDFIP